MKQQEVLDAMQFINHFRQTKRLSDYELKMLDRLEKICEEWDVLNRIYQNALHSPIIEC